MSPELTNLERVTGTEYSHVEGAGDSPYIIPSVELFSGPDYGAEISAKLDRIIELLEAQVGMIAVAQEEADKPEEVDRGYLDGYG